jgi:hypothetical protein
MPVGFFPPIYGGFIQAVESYNEERVHGQLRKVLLNIMLHPNPYLALADALNFTVADLEANRHGILTHHQRAYLESRRLKAIEPWALFLVGLLALGLVLRLQPILLVFGVCCLITGVVAAWTRSDADLTGRVRVTSGKLTAVAGRNVFSPRYHIRIGVEPFGVSASVKRAFDPARRYRVYYTSGTHTILSAELLG